MKIQAILFDLYGTLIASQERHFLRQLSHYHLRQLREGKHVAQLGARVLEMTQKLMRIDVFAQRLPPELLSMFALQPDEQTDEIEQEFREALFAESSTATLFSGTKTILSFFKRRGYAIGLVSNVSTYHKEPFFRFGLDRFVDVAVFSCDVGLAKPDPDMYVNACKQLGVRPEEVLFVGDSYNMDVKTPLSLGMRAIHVSPSGRYPYHIRDISEMGLILFTDDIYNMKDRINDTKPLVDRNIVLHIFVLLNDHDDREHIMYKCIGSQYGDPCEFYLKRALHPSTIDPGQAHSIYLNECQDRAQIIQINSESLLLIPLAKFMYILS